MPKKIVDDIKSKLKNLGITKFAKKPNETVIIGLVSGNLKFQRSSILESLKKEIQNEYSDVKYSNSVSVNGKTKKSSAGVVSFKENNVKYVVLLKPEGFLNFSLRPQDFKMDNSVYGYTDYIDTLSSRILEREKQLGLETTLFLSGLLQSVVNNLTTVNYYSEMFDDSTTFLSNKVNNEFSELLAPIIVINKHFSRTKNSVKISVPSVAQPAFDFDLKLKDRQMTFSVKSGAVQRPNTIKPGDFLRYIENKPVIKNKYKKEIEILEKLAEKKAEEGKKYLIEIFDLDEKKFNSELEAKTKKMKFTELMVDGLQDELSFVKFEYNPSQNKIISTVLLQDQLENLMTTDKRIFLRSKNVGERVGLTPP